MTAKDARTRAQLKYAATKLKRVPLDLKLTDYDELKRAASDAGETVNGYIKEAIRQRMKRDREDAS